MSALYISNSNLHKYLLGSEQQSPCNLLKLVYHTNEEGAVPKIYVVIVTFSESQSVALLPPRCQFYLWLLSLCVRQKGIFRIRFKTTTRRRDTQPMYGQGMKKRPPLRAALSPRIFIPFSTTLASPSPPAAFPLAPFIRRLI